MLLIMTIIALLIPIFALIILTFYIFLEKKALYKNFENLINQTKEDAKILQMKEIREVKFEITKTFLKFINQTKEKAKISEIKINQEEKIKADFENEEAGDSDADGDQSRGWRIL